MVTALPGAALYGEVPMRDLPIKEGHTWNPIGLHGIVAKAVVDLLNLYRADHTVEFTALVMSTVYGPRQRHDGGVVGSFAQALRDGVSPEIHGDGRQTRDFLYVDDAVDALVRAGASGRRAGRQCRLRRQHVDPRPVDDDGRPQCREPDQCSPAPQRHLAVRAVADEGPHPPGVGPVDRPQRRPSITGLNYWAELSG